MNDQFSPCSACARHVKRSDATCPFCGVANTAGPLASTAKAGAGSEATRTAAMRLSRAALFAAGTVGAAMAVTDCGSTVAVYGAFIPPESGDASTMTDAADSASGSSDSASASPADAGNAPEAASPAPGPTVQPVYGAPAPLYGGSPIRVDE